MKQNLTGKILVVIGIVFVCFAIVLYLHNETIARKAEMDANNILQEIQSGGTTEVTKQGTVISAGGRYYDGILEIPSLQLVLPVFAEMNDEDLATAPCVYSGRAEEDDLVIAGHNYTVQFGKLDRLNQGDLITYTNANHFVYTYMVSEIQILEDTEVEEMISSQYSLTLFTCDYSGNARITIRSNKNTP